MIVSQQQNVAKTYKKLHKFLYIVKLLRLIKSDFEYELTNMPGSDARITFRKSVQ
jgi:hypothetical protein